MVSGKWTEPRTAPFSKLGWEDDVPFISPDGKKLFFISRRPINREDRSKKENIWVIERLAGCWGEPKPLPPIVNSSPGIHHQLSIDGLGNLFFTAVQKSGFGEGDLYRSEFKNGEYRKPENLGPVINSAANENTPFVAPDGSYLIFCRYHADSWTLFVSFRGDAQGWGVPRKINSFVKVPEGMNLDSPLVTRDGKYLIFFCDDGKSTAPYWVDAKPISGPKTKR
jgi:Tol biopolymer transport system component